MIINDTTLIFVIHLFSVVLFIVFSWSFLANIEISGLLFFVAVYRS